MWWNGFTESIRVVVVVLISFSLGHMHYVYKAVTWYFRWHLMLNGVFSFFSLSLHRASFQSYPRAWYLILTPCICTDKRTSLNLKRGMLYIWCLGDVQRAVGGREYLLCWQNTRKSMRWRSCLPFEYPIPKTVSPRFHMYKLLSERKKESETIIWKRQLNRK